MAYARGRRGMLEFPCSVERLKNGNTLIADAGDETGAGSEIIEVNPEGQIVWQYGEGLRFAHSAQRLLNGNTLIADTTNNRVIEVNPAGEIVFTSDDWGNKTGMLSDGSHLHYPNDAHQLDDGNLIITDRNNNRCVIVDKKGNVKWTYDKDIVHPHNCDMLPNGNVIIADSDGKKVKEVNKDKEIVWQYGDGSSHILDWPRDADRLENGNTLITDSKNKRVIEVDHDGNLVWEYKVPYFCNFYEADKLPDGNVLISDQQHHRVIEVDPYGNIIWMFTNYCNTNIIHRKISNGSFKERGEDGLPKDWILYSRFSEGGGRVIWDETAKPRPCPGLEYDRSGVLCLQQVIAVKPGRLYRMAGRLKTQEMAEGSFAYLQMAFLDAYGGLVQDAAKAPKGNLFTGDNDWTEDSLEAIAPEEATAVELRVAICGKGKVFARSIMFFG